ncbi:MAG: AmmeMemoRadiSam system protein A [Planctomycetota bacterium]|jgi:AmmeMemoRadiSam system protein A
MDDSQQQTLLSFVRRTVESHLSGKALPAIPDSNIGVQDFGGMFVTFKNHGKLRGCMGHFKPQAGVLETAQKVAVSSLQDMRFLNNPITPKELKDINIEISILSSMTKTNDPASLEVGVHGIYIEKGFQSGCFLPQVATEQGWNKEQFLSYCCSSKAGLPSDAWKDPDTEVYLFTAQIISEPNQ